MLRMSALRNRIPALGTAIALAWLVAMSVCLPVLAQSPAPKAPDVAAKAKAGKGTPFAGFGGNSKEPIKIDANKLEVFDKENRAIYSGDVVAVQGQSTLRCTAMTIHYTSANSTKGATPAAPAPTPAAAPSNGQNSIRKIDCNGPVSVVSGTMSATSTFMTYDAPAETVTFTGNVIIADCDNVQRGERAVYDVKTGKATVDAGAKGRVQGIFTPGSEDKKNNPGECGGKKT